MLIIKNEISVKDYWKAYSIHYDTYVWTKIRPFFGVLFIIIGLILLFLERYVFGLICIIYSSYFFIAKWLYIKRLLKITKQNKLFGKPSKFEIFDDGKINITVDDDTASTSIKNMLYYTDNKEFVLLYPQSNFFYFFKDNELEKAGGKNKLVELLNRFDIKRK